MSNNLVTSFRNKQPQNDKKERRKKSDEYKHIKTLRLANVYKQEKGLDKQ